MAVTSDVGTNRGRPSSWSAAVDQLCFGDDDRPAPDPHFRWQYSRGYLESRVSGLATRSNRSRTRPRRGMRSQSEPYTDKSVITDPTYEGWEPVAPVGICARPAGHPSPGNRSGPLSRMSCSKAETGRPRAIRWIARTILACSPPSGIPTTRHFDIFRDTSAATALAGKPRRQDHRGHAAALARNDPRAHVHSAEWTPRDEAAVRCRELRAAETRAPPEVWIRRARLLPGCFERSERSDADRRRRASSRSMKDGSTIKHAT